MTTQSNIKRMYFNSIIGGVVFFLPILALYYHSYLGSMANVALIFAIEAVAISIFEIPTGAIADLFGRKRTLLMANAALAIAFFLLYIGSTMTVFVLAGILAALGQTLWSGSDQALIYDTLKYENKEKTFKKVIGNYYALWPLGAAVGSIIGGYLAKDSYSFPILLSVIPQIIIFINTLFIVEPDYHKSQDSVARHSLESIKMITKNKQLFLLMVAGMLLWGFGESIHLLTPLFFEFKEIPIIYFGYIYAALYLLSATGHYLSHFISEKIGNKTTLVLFLALSPIFTLLATQTFGIGSIIFFILPSLTWGIKGPVNDYLIQSEAPSDKRATIMSVYSVMARLGMFFIGPSMGYLADYYDINTSYAIGALCLFTVPAILLFIKDRK